MKTVEEYKETGEIRTGSSNKARARSLQKQAKERLKDVERSTLSEETASFRFEAAYEALRENIQAFMEAEGMKPYSHEATLTYAKEKELLSEKEFKKADLYRKIRNDITYRAERTSKERAKEIIEFAKRISRRLGKKFEKEYPRPETKEEE